MDEAKLAKLKARRRTLAEKTATIDQLNTKLREILDSLYKYGDGDRFTESCHEHALKLMRSESDSVAFLGWCASLGLAQCLTSVYETHTTELEEPEAGPSQ